MSWSITIDAHGRDELVTCINEASPSFHVTEASAVRAAVEAQLDTCKKAARIMLEECSYMRASIIMRGHVNAPDVDPRINVAAWPHFEVVITEAK